MKQINFDDEVNRLKIMRQICKRPVIVTAYAATKRTIMLYIYEEIKNQNLKFFKGTKHALAGVIVKISIECISKELALIKYIQTNLHTTKANFS